MEDLDATHADIRVCVDASHRKHGRREPRYEMPHHDTGYWIHPKHKHSLVGIAGGFSSVFAYLRSRWPALLEDGVLNVIGSSESHERKRLEIFTGNAMLKIAMIELIEMTQSKLIKMIELFKMLEFIEPLPYNHPTTNNQPDQDNKPTNHMIFISSFYDIHMLSYVSYVTYDSYGSYVMH